MKVLYLIALAAIIAVVYGDDTCSLHRDCRHNDDCDYDDTSVCHNGTCECTDGPTGKACLQEPDCNACPANHHALCVDFECHCADSDDHTYG